MKRRWLCGILVLCTLLTLLPGLSLGTKAYEDMAVTQELVDFVKKLEGFAKYPYWDYTQYTVGYGSACPSDKLSEYKANGIPEDEAEALLREDLDDFEKEVNDYAKKYGLTFSQQQFDALVSLSFNCGGNWMRETYGILNYAIRNGLTGTDLLYAFGLYSRSGTDYVLIKRRLCEVNMYLNGVYKAYNIDQNAIPTNYKYVFLDGNGGEMSYVIHAYDANEQSEVLTNFKSIPTGVDANGQVFVYEFAGWYTAGTDGTLVEKLDGSLANATVLYAQWKDPDGNIVVLPKGDVVDDLKITVTGQSVNVRSGPGTFYAKTGTVTNGAVVIITETYTFNGVLWGKFSEGWISLSYTDYESVLESLEPEPEWPLSGIVTGNNVNVRSGPGTSNPMQYQLSKGAVVSITEIYDDGSLEWGKLEDGNWICMTYVQLDSQEEETTPTPTVTGISMLKLPDQTEYVQMQDDLDLQGSVLQVHYSDGSVAALTLTRKMISSYSNATLGQTTVKISHEGFTTSFKVTIVKATVTFLHEDGTVLSQNQYAYGDAVTLPETPVKAADGAGSYRFVGWTPEVTACNGDAAYTAVFELVESDQPQYTVGDVNGDGIVNYDDADYLLMHISLPEDYPVAQPIDFNGDGAMDYDDADYLLMHVSLPEDYPLVHREESYETTE